MERVERSLTEKGVYSAQKGGAMPRVTVYYFTKYDITVGEMGHSQRPATLETIIVCEGKLLEETAQQVDVAELDENGFYTPKDTSGTEGGVEGGRGETL